MIEPEEIRGSDVSYVNICKRRGWLSTFEILITTDSDLVKDGIFLNEIGRKKGFSQVSIGRNKIDYVQFLPEGIIVHEYKRGRKLLGADEMQIAHYMNILSRSGFIVLRGEIHLLGSKKIIRVKLTDEVMERLQDTYQQLQSLKRRTIPGAERIYFCKHGCSFADFCWG